MTYARVVDPGVVPDGQVALHVPAGTPEPDVAKAAYRLLRGHAAVGLVAGGRPAGVMTMTTVLPVLLTLGGNSRGEEFLTRGDAGAAAGRTETARWRCRFCGAVAYALAPAVPSCPAPGHGPMVAEEGTR